MTKPRSKRQRYDSVSTETRRMLIKLIFEDKISIYQASKILHMKYSTAKNLVQYYRKTGVIDRVKQ